MRNFVDLTGQRFGTLTVERQDGYTKYGTAKWLCKCDCGNHKTITSSNLKNTKTCGASVHKVHDLTGQRFGKLTVMSFAGRSDHGKTMWLCRCDCGNEKAMAAYSLKNGNSKSCGCGVIEATVSRNTKHGLHHTRLYELWKGMHARCNNPKHSSYRYYGGKGVRICPEWDDYQTFHDWAMANGYDPNAKRGKCTIDRIDPNGDYEPGNCRFVDMHVQRVNQSRMKKEA